MYVDELRTFYLEEDIPRGYARREFPYYSIEANGYIDRMAHHIGFQPIRPWPPNDADGRDVEPIKAQYERVRLGWVD